MVKFLLNKLESLKIQVPKTLGEISEEAIDVSTETNFVSNDDYVKDLKQIANNATFALNTLKSIVKIQEDRILRLQDILNQDLSNKIEQNNKKIKTLISELNVLNIPLSDDLKKNGEIPVLKINDLSIGKLETEGLDNIIKQKLDQINNVQEIIKKQDSQITQLTQLINKKKLPAELTQKNIEIGNLNKTVKDNNKKIENLASKLKELNVKLSSNLTNMSKIPGAQLGDYSCLNNILKLRSEQINDLKKIIKKQDDQITQLSEKLMEATEEKYSQLTSLKQIVEKNNRKIDFFANLFKSNKYLELPKDLIATSEIEDLKLKFDEKKQDVVKIYSDILQRHSSYIDVIKKQNDQINNLKDITSQTIENLYECDTIGSRALGINEVREKMNLQNLTVNAENEKHLTQQLINNYKLKPSDVIKFENMAKDILNDKEISSVINQFNADRKNFINTKIESRNLSEDDDLYNTSFLWSDLIDNKDEIEICNTLKEIYKNIDDIDYDEELFDMSKYALFLFAYLVSMADNYQEYNEIINKMVGNNKDLEKIFNALQSIIVIADPDLTKDRTMLNEIGCADMKLIDFSLLCKRAQFITTQYFNNISSNIESMQDKCRLDEHKNDIKSAKNIDNEISELEEKENEIRKAKLLNNIIKLKYKDTDKSVTIEEITNGISYSRIAASKLPKLDKIFLPMLNDALDKFKDEFNNKINEMKIKACVQSVKNNFIDSEEFDDLKTKDELYQKLIFKNQNSMSIYSGQDKIDNIKGNKMLIDILKKELGLGDIKKRNLFDAIIKYEDYDQYLFDTIINNKVDVPNEMLDAKSSDFKAWYDGIMAMKEDSFDESINELNNNKVDVPNEMSSDESFPFKDANHENENDKISSTQVKNPFSDVPDYANFKPVYDMGENPTFNNISANQSLLSKIDSAQNNEIYNQNEISDDEQFPFEDENNNNKINQISLKQIENPFQDMNKDDSFKLSFSQAMNLKQNNIDTKQSLLDKVNSAQSNNNIPDMDNDDANKFL